MKKIRRLTKEEKKSNFEIMGLHLAKYRKLMLVFCSFVLLTALAFSIYWHFDPNSISPLIDGLYLVSHLVFLTTSVFLITLLILNKYNKVGVKHMAVSIHIYSFLLIGWSTVLCILDLSAGSNPEIFLLAATFVAGILSIDPIFFSITSLSSLSVVMIYQGVRQYPYFSNEYIFENILHFGVFVLLLILIAFRSHHIMIEEFKAKAQLEYLNNHDELTGLYNERSYFSDIDEITKSIKEGTVEPFAVVMMDVNNLKATNDAFGHQYGCHLVVKCGKDLPKTFKSSKLYHIGGDEFIAIVRGHDLEHFEEKMQEFDEKFSYSIIKFGGQDLIFSVARGYSLYEKGDRYKEVLQRADQAMYENKAMLKAKHNMKVR